MLTKQQKKEIISETVEALKGSHTLVFADHASVDTKSINKLKQELKKSGAKFKVIKKTLLKLALKEAGIDFDPLQFSAQVGTILIPKDLSSVAGVIYKLAKEFAKAKKNFQVLGGYDVDLKGVITAEQFSVIAKLPSREVLLGQVVGVMSGPIRAFMYIVDQLSKKTSPAAVPASEAPASAV